ncbi:hypothetical protein L1887_40058 [Cichorium endivia]|nr:hypothetical protein L1887_40058 [Cichorium endivia]
MIFYFYVTHYIKNGHFQPNSRLEREEKTATERENNHHFLLHKSHSFHVSLGFRFDRFLHNKSLYQMEHQHQLEHHR